MTILSFFNAAILDKLVKDLAELNPAAFGRDFLVSDPLLHLYI